MNTQAKKNQPFECLTYMREQWLTPHEARELTYIGWKLVKKDCGLNKDLYDIYARRD